MKCQQYHCTGHFDKLIQDIINVKIPAKAMLIFQIDLLFKDLAEINKMIDEISQRVMKEAKK